VRAGRGLHASIDELSFVKLQRSTEVVNADVRDATVGSIPQLFADLRHFESFPHAFPQMTSKQYRIPVLSDSIDGEWRECFQNDCEIVPPKL
jgi:hypothetical protein